MNARHLLCAGTLALTACASTPHGTMFGALSKAPDLVTGAGCENYGVYRSDRFHPVATEPRFEPHFIQPWEVDQFCRSPGRRAVWGCYHDDGSAYIVGRDWKVYWHEWCHAKLGAGHSDERFAGNDGLTARQLAAGF